MNKMLMPILLALSISACDSSSPATNTQPSPGNIPGTVEASAVVEPTAVNTRIRGELLLHDNIPANTQIAVNVRNSNIVTTMQPDGEFLLEIPPADNERSVTLDITGASIIPKSVAVRVPAEADQVTINAAVAGRTAPITFNLDAGGELQNPGSQTRTKVTVPPNAFVFADGSNATGDAQVSITEIDITDLEGDSAWAPNLIGIPEGMTEPEAIYSFGMSDFHFSQDGRALQLRSGVNATISMDLISPFMFVEGDSVPSPAVAGSVTPLWHYDVEDMIWKEEGEATIVADSQSDSGFSTTGEVGHFSTWNFDYVTPSIIAKVVVVLVDGDGVPRNDLDVLSYHTTARIPPVDGPGWHNEGGWKNTSHMTPQNNRIRVLANLPNRASQIQNNSSVTGYTTMEFLIDNIMVDGIEKVISEETTVVTETVIDGETVSSQETVVVDRTVVGIAQVNEFPIKRKKIFFNHNGDDTIVVFIVVDDNGTPTEDPRVDPEAPQPDPDPIPRKLGYVEVEIVDFFGNIQTEYTVQSYTVTAVSNKNFASQQTITPPITELTVEANDQRRLDSDEDRVTMEFTLNDIVIQGRPDLDPILPSPISKVFSMLNSDDTVTFSVVIMDQ